MSVNTDDLMAGLLAEYDAQPPGVKAAVEQEAAKIRDDLTGIGKALTVPTLRRYFAQVIAIGLAENVGIGPEDARAADVLGMRLAGVCVLRREIEGQP